MRKSPGKDYFKQIILPIIATFIIMSTKDKLYAVRLKLSDMSITSQ